MREGVEQTALPLGARPSGRRSLDECLTLAAPRLARMVGALVFRLPPRSSLRRHLVARIVRQQYEAFRRRDLDVVLSRHDPRVEVVMPQNSGAVASADLDDVYRGYEGLHRLWSAWLEPWAEGLRAAGLSAPARC